MATKPSLRSQSHSKPVDLNLVPYLDIVVNIIMFMLLTSTGLIQIGVINVNAPRYVDPMSMGDANENQAGQEKLNLTVGITYKGLFIAGVGGVLGSTEETDNGGSATLPLLLSDSVCQKALAEQKPPPPVCYDYKKLTLEMVKIKNLYPSESKIIIYAQPDVPFEVLVKVMDASRQDEEGKPLFFDVVLSPEIA